MKTNKLLTKQHFSKRKLDLLRDNMTYYDDLQRKCDYDIDKLERLFDTGIIFENADPMNNDMS